MTEDEIHFTRDDGQGVFSSPLADADISFPRYLPDGLVVSSNARRCTFLFADPYLGQASGVAVRAEWRQAIAALDVRDPKSTT